MAESESNSHLAAPGDGDVERLLREAESLTREVAREVGIPARDADALLSGELSDASPAPIETGTESPGGVMSLEDLLGELGPGESAAGAPVSPLASAANFRSAPGVGGARSAEVLASDRGPRVEHMPEVEPDSPPRADNPASPPSEKSDAASSTPRTPPKPKPPFHKRALSLGRAGGRGIKTAILIMVRDVPVGVLSFVDVPFRRTPRPIKNAIGIIGAITLAMGAFAWALPGLMRPSPPAAHAAHEAPSGH